MTDEKYSPEQQHEQDFHMKIVEIICDGIDGLKSKHPSHVDDLNTIQHIFREGICVMHAVHFFKELNYIYMTLYTANLECEISKNCPLQSKHEAWEDVLSLIEQSPSDVVQLMQLL